MTAKELLSYLLRQGIELWVEGDRLRYRGLKRTLPPQLMALLRQHKVELQELLRELQSKAAAPFPLSHTQKAFWFLHQLNPTSSAYNGCLAITLRGAVSTPALHRAFEQLCMRHPSLRTSLVLCDGLPWQKVDAKPSCVLSIVDATKWTEGALYEHLQAEAHRPFDLLREAAHRLYLYERSAQESVLLLCMHHIHMDGWSLGILIRDFGALYRSQLSGQPAQLPALPAAYSDFVAWQQHLLLSADGESQITYWLDDLVGVPQVLELPTDWPRPKAYGNSGARLQRAISASLSQQLKVLAAQEGTTLNVLLFSAFATLLHRYSGQEEFLIGSPYHGRSERRWEQVLGCFINSLALRVRFPAGLTFRALLQEVSLRSHAALTHADYPFPLLVERLQPQREPGRTPLFQVMFGYENFQGADLLLSTLAGATQSTELDSVFGVPLTTWDLSQQEGQFDLSMVAAEANGVLCYSLSYINELFEKQTIERLASHFEQLLRAVIENPEQSIASLCLLSKVDRDQLLGEWNPESLPLDTTQPRFLTDAERQLLRGRWSCTDAELALPATLAQHFEAQVAQSPHSLALVYDDQRLTYGELNAWANQLAHHLRGQGVGPDVPVALAMERSLQLLVGVLAVLKAGGAYLPLDPDNPDDRLALMLEEGRPAALLTERRLVGRLRAPGVPITFLDDRDLLAAQPTTNPPPSAASQHLAYIIFTSGSTGRPKGVCIAQSSVLNLAYSLRQLAFQGPPQRVAWVAPIVFDASVQQIFGALLFGHCLYITSQSTRRDGHALLSFLRTQAIELCDCTPSLLSLLLEAGLPAARELQLRTLLCGGEELPASLVAALYAQGSHPQLTLINVYGPTECCVDATAYVVRPGQPSGRRSTVPIGRPLANTTVYILDQLLQPVPIGVAGQLYIGGVGLARGYLHRPDLTREKFITNPFASEPGARLYQTGDRGRFLPDGNIEFLGRIDHQVKLRGFRIELGEIESVLCSYPQVRACVVLVHEDPPGDRRLIAYVVPQPEEQPSSASLREHLATKLPDYMLPAAFVFLAALPLSPNGKLDRSALPAPSYERSADDFAPPRTAIERSLADIFAQILHLERVGIHENFFSLGGHSLLATQAVSRVRGTLGVELSVAALFSAPTVAGLAAAVTPLGGDPLAQDMPPVAVVPRDLPLPLSFAQQRMWFLEQLDSDLPLYNIPSALRLRGPLDRECLRRSLQELVDRHESLRTTFSSGEPEPLQLIHPPSSSWPLPLLDLTVLPAVSREAEVTAAAQREARLPFSLDRGPLLRTTLVRVAEQDHVLLLTLHHIISDGWSLGVLFRELSALYTAFHERRPADLPELRAQVADISAWQRQLLQGERLQQELSYWKAQLAGCPPLELPTDHQRPPVLSYRGRILTFSLDASLGRDLNALAQSQQATLFMTLLGSFAVLLSRYSQQTDIAVGSPIAGRTCTEMEPLIGCFVNTLVLRTSLEKSPSFRELLARVRKSCLDAYSHQQLPFERLVDELHVTRDRSRNPLFQVMFVLQNAPLDELRLPGLASSHVLVHQQSSKFDLTLAVEEKPDGSLSGVFEYATDLFEPATIERMAGHYARLLREIVAHPDRSVAELQLMTDGERLQLLAQWNATRVELVPQSGLAQSFQAQVERSPDSIAVAFADQRLSYRELNARANQLAHHLRSQGVGPDVLVGLAVERCADLVVGLLGILKAGGAYLPLDPDHPSDRIAFMIAEGRPAALVTERRLADRFAATAVPLTFIDDPALLASYPVANPAPLSGPAHLAYAIFTSGSTGLPKGVCISQGSVLNLVHSLRQLAFVDPPQRVAWVAPVVFDASVQQLFGALLFGHCLYVVSESTRRDGQALLAFLRAQSIELCDCTPSLLSLLVAAGLPAARDLCLRTLLCGGEELPASLVAALHAPGGQPQLTLINVYGPTECCVDATAYTVPPGSLGAQRSSIPIGRPLANTQVYILDPQLQPVPIGVPGQLYIGGAGLARGYLNRPELTRERFIPDPFSTEPGARLYQTGDRCRFLPDGNIEYLGRLDHQVKLRGFRIELGEIESVLASHPRVRACAVLAREDSPGDKRLIAYVVAQPGPQPVGSDLREHLAVKLPDYMLPAAFVFLEALPQTPSGKLDRQALPAPSYARGPEPLAAPRTPLEQTLVELFARLLHHDRIGIHDNFFTLGGHSLLAVRLAAQLARRTGQALPLSTLFQHPTVAGLAAVLETRAAALPHKTVLALQPGGSRPPLFCVHPVGGNVLCYVELTRALGTRQPVYGVQATPVAADDPEPPETLEAVASRYITALRQVQPARPYQLLGWSLGGVLAFEMARQLHEAGQRVALLALIDSAAPVPQQPAEPPAALSEPALLQWFLSDLTRQRNGVTAALPDKAPTDLRAALPLLSIQGLLPSDTEEAQLAALYALFRRNLRLAIDYRPGPYEGPVLLLRAAASSAVADLGWQSLCSGTLELVGLPGDHYTILSPPIVGTLARLLSAWLLGSEPTDHT